jgi:hypothetical protein
MSDARLTLAWLMWCYGQGYTHPDDRAILHNWMGDDASMLTAVDVIERDRLLVMADEILAAVSAGGEQHG